MQRGNCNTPGDALGRVLLDDETLDPWGPIAGDPAWAIDWIVDDGWLDNNPDYSSRIRPLKSRERTRLYRSGCEALASARTDHQLAVIARRYPDDVIDRHIVVELPVALNVSSLSAPQAAAITELLWR